MKTVFQLAYQVIGESPSFYDGKIDKPKELGKHRSENDNKLHVEEVREIGNQTKIGDKEYKVSDLDTRKNEKNKEQKRATHHDLEDSVHRMQRTYHEIMDVLDIKYFHRNEQVMPYHLDYMK